MKKENDIIGKYIAKAFEAGEKEGNIKKYLKSAGWAEADISYALNKFDMKSKSKVAVPRNYKKDLREDNIFGGFLLLIFIAILSISEVFFNLIDLFFLNKNFTWDISLNFLCATIITSVFWAGMIYVSNSKSLFKINSQQKFVALGNIVNMANIVIFIDSIYFILYILDGEYLASTLIKMVYILIVAGVVRSLSAINKK